MLTIKLNYKFIVIVSLQLLLFSSIILISKPLMASNKDDIEHEILKIRQVYPTEDEYIYLPNFCVLRIKELKIRGEGKGLSPTLARERELYVRKLGPDTWQYLHHFAAGINKIGRYERSVMLGLGSQYQMTEKQKQTLLGAIGDFAQIERPYLKFKSLLYPATIQQHAKALKLLGRMPEAIAKLKEGINAMPTRDTFYLYYAEILLESGNKVQAKKVLDWGYKQTYGSKKISKMLSGLK